MDLRMVEGVIDLEQHDVLSYVVSLLCKSDLILHAIS